MYYGDEVGLTGDNDPFCRKPFPWRQRDQDLALLALYQRLGKLRQQSRALRQGGCRVIYTAGDVVVFVRVFQRERVLVALNRGGDIAVELPWDALLGGRQWATLEGHARLEERDLLLPAISATVWRSR